MPPDVAVTYDGARTSALIASGRAEEALTFLAEREKALPESYLPPHYQCRALRALARHAEALAACDRAIGKAYGPRKASIFGLEATICAEKKDVACERKALEAQIDAGTHLPASQQPTRAIAEARARLGALE
jgi:hypothetical protein